MSMKYNKVLFLISSVFLIFTAGVSATADFSKLSITEPAGTVYRLYNPNTGEHFYTIGSFERDSLVSVGWRDEGVGWFSSESGEPVYRLFNPNAKGGDHYYTKSPFERDSLVKKGWKAEGIGWNSGGDIDVHVAYNPNAQSGAHNYTTDSNEQDFLLANGWKYGETAWQSLQPISNTGKLPASKTGAVLSSTDLDTVINKMHQLVLKKGKYQLGNFVTVFSRGTYYLNGYVNAFKDDVYQGNELSTPSLFPVNIDNPEPVYFGYASNFGDFKNGSGYVTAVLTAKGWYLLPEYKLHDSRGMLVTPDYTKFIQTGNIADLRVNSQGEPLVLEPGDQFGYPVLIS